MPTPTHNYDAYREAVRETFNGPLMDWRFKSDPRYQLVLEHVSPAQGEEFLDNILNDKIANSLDQVKDWILLNDSVGAPVQHYFSRLDLKCSPTNLRYLWHAILTLRHIRAKQLTFIEMIEIGGGYGGLCFYLHKLAPTYGILISSYTLFDIPEVALLQAMYLSYFGIKVITGIGSYEAEDSVPIDERYQYFLLSTYAFSEFDAEMRSWYERHVIPYCYHGFLVWNFSQGIVLHNQALGGPVYQFTKYPLVVTPEIPLTSPDNYFVRF